MRPVGQNGVILQSGSLELGTSSISGTVTVAGTGLEGVTVTLSGPVSVVTVSAAYGAYNFTGLSDGTYTVTPTLSGYAFSPASREIIVAGGNINGQDFADANHSIMAAYQAAVTGNIIRAWGTEYSEDLTFNMSKSLIFKGGMTASI